MIKADLITGFLGSGKTTFIKKYAQYLMSKGERIAILENDYGAINIDMLLLQDILGDQCDLEMVIGGDFDCHRRRFRTKLIALGMAGYDRVIVEPSGIYDVDEFFDALHDSPLDRWYEPGNVIAIIDARLEQDLTKESRYILASEIADAGKVILSRTQETGPLEIKGTIELMNSVLAQFHCERRFGYDVEIRPWDELGDEDMEAIRNCGYIPSAHVKLPVLQNNEYDTLFFMNVELASSRLEETVETILNDPECGDIFRIKGFLKTEEGGWLEANATHSGVEIKPSDIGQEVFIVIGEHLNKEKIGSYWKYLNEV